MSIRTFVDKIEATCVELFAALARQTTGGLRRELDDVLRQMEAARVAGGEDPHAARATSWKRVKALHGLGYPVDFSWLHEPVAVVQRVAA